MSVLQFPTKKTNVHEIRVRLEVDVLEDGSQWYRIENLKTKAFGEWIKMENKENEHD